jgi:WD40 repeat protein
VEGRLVGDEVTFQEAKGLIGPKEVFATPCTWKAHVAGDRMKGTWWRTKDGAGTFDFVRKKNDRSPSAGPGSSPDHGVVGEVHCFMDHKGSIWCVACSPDGKIGLAGGGRGVASRKALGVIDSDIYQFDLTSRKLIRKLSGHTDTVKGLAITNDGKTAVSASWDGTVRLWDLETGRQLHKMEGHTDKLTGVAFIPGDKRVVSCAVDGTVRLWNSLSGQELKKFTGHRGPVWSVAVSPDRTGVLAGGGADGANRDFSLRWWDIMSNKEVISFVGHKEGVNAVAISPDGRRVLSGDSHGNGIVWDVATGGIVHEMPGHSVCFSTDGRIALTGCNDKTIRLWDASDWREWKVFRGHTDIVQGVALSADGRYALSGSWDGTVRLWHLPGGRER